jgi:hypothetical protein
VPALVVRLQRPEVLERPRPRVVHVAPAPGSAAEARQPEHRRRLRAPEGVRPAAVLRPVPPHVHLPFTFIHVCMELVYAD